LCLLLLGCAHHPSSSQPLGRESRPYSSLPAYLQDPVAEHDLTAPERMKHISEVLHDIDARAGQLPEGEEELKRRVTELGQLLPPSPSLLAPVQRMQLVVDEIPKSSAEDTRRRLWALTDLIRLRAHF